MLKIYLHVLPVLVSVLLVFLALNAGAVSQAPTFLKIYVIKIAHQIFLMPLTLNVKVVMSYLVYRVMEARVWYAKLGFI